MAKTPSFQVRTIADHGADGSVLIVRQTVIGRGRSAAVQNETLAKLSPAEALALVADLANVTATVVAQ